MVLARHCCVDGFFVVVVMGEVEVGVCVCVVWEELKTSGN